MAAEVNKRRVALIALLDLHSSTSNAAVLRCRMRAIRHESVILFMSTIEDQQRNGVFPSRIEGYTERTVPKYTEFEFRSHFRMKRTTYENLMERLQPQLTFRIHPPQTKRLAFLWLLGNLETFRSVADRFGMGKSSLHKIVNEVADAMLGLAPEVIRFPNDIQKWHAVAKRFKLPGVVGCVDGTYIPMTGKRGEQRDAYICRKGFPAMHAQIVSDSNLKIMDVCTGYPGSVHDARVYRNSPISQTSLPVEFHLLGDSTYQLDISVMTHYRDNGHLTDAQKKFNAIHSSDRCCVERCIGLLKGKFRRLKNFNARDDTLMCKMIVCAAVMHNIILELEVVDESEISLQEESFNSNLSGCRQITQDSSAARKRDRLCAAL